METKLDCDAFANAHSSDSHYDKQSFVGLAVSCTLSNPIVSLCLNSAKRLLSFPSPLCAQWRPQGESICAEAYSTGKCNIPGSKRERDMLRSWSRMVPELYAHSVDPNKALKFSAELQNAHKQNDGNDTKSFVTTGSHVHTSKRAKTAGGVREASSSSSSSFVIPSSSTTLWEDGNSACTGFSHGYDPEEDAFGADVFESTVLDDVF